MAISNPTEVEETVINKIRHRRDFGRKKYGVTMERGDLTLSEWFKHAQDEVLDAAIYLEKCMRVADKWKELAMIAFKYVQADNSPEAQAWIKSYMEQVGK